MGLTLKNAEAIANLWSDMMDDPDLLGVLIRHAHKPSDGKARCGLSQLGEEQARLYGEAIVDTMRELVAVPARFVSSVTARNIRTLDLLVEPAGGVIKIGTPLELDLPDLGPNDEDLATCRALAARLNAKLEPGQKPFSPNSLFSRLEEYGETRVGETPAASEARIRKWMLDDAADSGPVFIYSMNSPVGNRATKVGVDEALAELEVIFIGDDANGGFCLLGRIAPEWEEIAD